MPVLTLNSYQENMQVFGRGVEACNFSSWGYLPTRGKLPTDIGIDYFRSHPGTLPALRRVARLALFATIRSNIVDTEVAGTVIDALSKSSIREIGDIYLQRTDRDRTTNYVIPLNTGRDELEIVVNAAWGVSWRLGKNHKLIKQYPSLAVCQPEDTSVKNKFEGKRLSNLYYLSPGTLEATTRDYVDPEILAQRIHAFLINLQEQKLVSTKELITTTSHASASEKYSQAHSVKVEWRRGSGLPQLGISFLLGAREGIKSLHIFGYSGSNLDTLKPLREEAQAIGGLVHSFYSPSSFQNPS